MKVLVDGGSTPNFIQERLATYLGLTISTSPNFHVMIGNGDTMCCVGVCSRVPLLLDGHWFVVDLYVLPIRGAGVVLGMQWLATLGPILIVKYKGFYG
ncbi:hypothetical protein Pint_05639 [Pistacia integerrima]|uniref:Uncharacterized protein n=1 Tax=Pistacia integerrima TaxID=434235 RepID=A0ACC0Z6H4_9ROSI|nr:hypothetical protein Pint_05639 [Pistacia integerrima]